MHKHLIINWRENGEKTFMSTRTKKSPSIIMENLLRVLLGLLTGLLIRNTERYHSNDLHAPARAGAQTFRSRCPP